MYVVSSVGKPVSSHPAQSAIVRHAAPASFAAAHVLSDATYIPESTLKTAYSRSMLSDACLLTVTVSESLLMYTGANTGTSGL